jgi:hypothetical protein
MSIRIITNARFYSMGSPGDFVGALAIQGGKILAAGTADHIQAEFGAKAEIDDLQGQVVLPGLTDAHIHLLNYAHSLTLVNCETATLAECLRAVTERVSQTPPGSWVRGHGWNQNEWPDSDAGLNGFPNAQVLDAISSEHPIYLTAKSLHAGWANSAALKFAGIRPETVDPPNGELQRDAAGNPTGILFEGAMGLVAAALARPTHDDNVDAVSNAQQELWKMGLTGVHDFDRRACFAAVQDLNRSGRLALRITKSLPVESLTSILDLGLRTGFGNDMLRIGNIKAFADGALGPHTAAMIQPYEDEPDNRGILLMDREAIFEHGRMAADGGLAMVVHAIGDQANHEVLEAYDQLRAYEASAGLPALRHRIEHVQLLHPSDMNRLAALDLIASMQPIHATSDMKAADQFWGKRAANGYAWRSMLEYETRLSFGSDAPVDSPNPFWGIHAAVTRRRQDGSPGPEGWYPGQRLTRYEAIQAYTTAAAYAATMEHRLGQLKSGHLADLIVLSVDPFECSPDELAQIAPTAVMSDGNWVIR